MPRRPAYLIQQVLRCAAGPPIAVYATLVEAVRQEGGRPSPASAGPRDDDVFDPLKEPRLEDFEWTARKLIDVGRGTGR